MTARRTPSAQDAAAARRILLDAVAGGIAVGERHAFEEALAPSRPVTASPAAMVPRCSAGCR